jgi:hypothetical protein
MILGTIMKAALVERGWGGRWWGSEKDVSDGGVTADKV